MATGGTGSRRGRRAGALLASLLTHGVVVVLLVRGTPRTPPASAPPEPLEIELVEPEPPSPAEPAAAESVGPPAPRQPAAPRPRERPSPTPGPSPTPAAEPAGPAEPPPSSSPGLLRMRTPNLTLDDATLDRFSREGVIAPPGEGLPEAPARRPGGQSKWQEKLALIERHDRGRANVEQGKVHPQIYDVMRTAEKVFEPRESVVEQDPRAPNTVGRSVRSWSRGFFGSYLEQLRNLEKTEPTRKSALAEGGSDIVAEYGRLLRAAEKGAQSIACQVCLVVRPGLPPEVVMASSSGNKEVDDAAMEALRRSSARQELEKDVKAQRACYRFAATIHRIPPLPIVGCSFDEVALKIGCYYPGKQIYRLKVSLDLVDYGG